MGTALGDFLKSINPLRALIPRETQSGVLPYRIVDGRITYLLITSRRSARWMFPKGSLIAGKTAWDSAAQEALEEAGVEGTVESLPIGSYHGAMNDENQTPVIVDIYALEVSIEHDEWREKRQRQRRWVTIEEARNLLDDREKIAIAVALDARLRHQLRSARQVQAR
jgi:8-oxo-dGTP pyrophosphatase MutT (NUDIX family)